MPLRILLAEDHLVLRQRLRALVERGGFNVIAEASDGCEAVRLAQQLHPDIAILDFAMPVLNGVDACREILKVSPQTLTILLTIHKGDIYVLNALLAGARGYVVKTQAVASLVQAIQQVARGGIYTSPEISRGVVEACLAKATLPGDLPAPRECRVLQPEVEGMTSNETADLKGGWCQSTRALLDPDRGKGFMDYDSRIGGRQLLLHSPKADGRKP
jgi:DNA-binding NarL/FixJ family response regulator